MRSLPPSAVARSIGQDSIRRVCWMGVTAGGEPKCALPDVSPSRIEVLALDRSIPA